MAASFSPPGALEVSPGVVFFSLALFVALHVALHAAAYLRDRKSGEEVGLEAEQRRLKAEIAPLSTVKDFVAKSLLERKLVKAEKEIARAAGARTARAGARWAPAPLLRRYVQPAVCALALAAMWHATPLRVPPALLPWPWVSRDGAVGPAVWLAAVYAVTGAVVPRVATAAGFALAAPPSGLLAMAQSWLG